MGRLVSEGKLGERYSCHDFRHYFAVREYSKDKDIWRVSRLLGHNGIAVTEKYLKALGESKRRRFPVKLHSVCLYP
jgi:integrase